MHIYANCVIHAHVCELCNTLILMCNTCLCIPVCELCNISSSVHIYANCVIHAHVCMCANCVIPVNVFWYANCVIFARLCLYANRVIPVHVCELCNLSTRIQISYKYFSLYMVDPSQNMSESLREECQQMLRIQLTVIFPNTAKNKHYVNCCYAFHLFRLHSLVYSIKRSKREQKLQMFISLAISACAPFTNLSSIINLYRVKLERESN